jgi:hypothetical protein
MTHNEVAAKLQVALLGEVFPSLRGAGFSLEQDKVRLVLYHDGPLSEEDRESASCIETELMALLPRSVAVVTDVIRKDAPTKMPDPEQWIFRRRE